MIGRCLGFIINDQHPVRFRFRWCDAIEGLEDIAVVDGFDEVAAAASAHGIEPSRDIRSIGDENNWSVEPECIADFTRSFDPDEFLAQAAQAGLYAVREWKVPLESGKYFWVALLAK